MKYVLSDLQKNVFRECTSLKKPFILCQLTEKSQTKEIYVNYSMHCGVVCVHISVHKKQTYVSKLS